EAGQTSRCQMVVEFGAGLDLVRRVVGLDHVAGWRGGHPTILTDGRHQTDESPAAAATGLSLPGPGEAPDLHFYSDDRNPNTTGRVSNDSAFQPTVSPNGAV